MMPNTEWLGEDWDACELNVRLTNRLTVVQKNQHAPIPAVA